MTSTNSVARPGLSQRAVIRDRLDHPRDDHDRGEEVEHPRLVIADGYREQEAAHERAGNGSTQPKSENAPALHSSEPIAAHTGQPPQPPVPDAEAPRTDPGTGLLVAIMRHADTVITLPSWSNYRFSRAGYSPEGGLHIEVRDEATGAALAGALALPEVGRWQTLTARHREPIPVDSHDVRWAGEWSTHPVTLHAHWRADHPEATHDHR